MSRRVASLLAIVVVVVTAGRASAQPPPSTTDPAPTQLAPPGRGGPFVDVSLGFGVPGIIGGGLQLGWMIDSWVGVFASVGGFLADESAVTRKAIGVRLASGAVFADAEFASLAADSECDLDEPCGDSHVHVAIIGVGVEVVHHRHDALDLHLQVITDGHAVVPLAGFGLSYYF